MPYALNFAHSTFALALVYQARGRTDAANQIGESVVSYGLDTNNPAVLKIARAFQAELAALSAEEAKVQLGETDVASDEEEQNPMIDIPEEERTIAFGEDGTIRIPVGACTTPTNNSDRIIFMKNLDGETQVHYSRLGMQPELLKYYIEAPKAGKYELTLRVVTVSRDQTCLLRLNRRTLIDLDLPSTWGKWQDTKPIEIDLREGRNTLMFTCRAPNRGVTIKSFTLSPAG